MTVGDKEFYDVIEMFKKTAKHIIRVGHQGYEMEDKDNWSRGIYFTDGGTNESFKVFLAGYSLGKSIGIEEL